MKAILLTLYYLRNFGIAPDIGAFEWSINNHWVIDVQTIQNIGKETKSGETAQPAVFRILRSGKTDISQVLTIYYTLSGDAKYDVDYTLASGYGYYNTSEKYGAISIPANQQYVDLQFNILDDTLAESPENIVLSILNDTLYASQPTGYLIGNHGIDDATIEDNEVCWEVNVTSLVTYAAETNTGQTAQPAKFHFTRSGSSDLSQPLKVYYELAGTATKGTDYAAPTTYEYDDYTYEPKYYVTIPANLTYIDLSLNITNDNTVEEYETILVKLLPPNQASSNLNIYRFGSMSVATVILQDNDGTMQVSAGGPYEVWEGGTVPLTAEKLFDPFGAGEWTYYKVNKMAFIKM